MTTQGPGTTIDGGYRRSKSPERERLPRQQYVLAQIALMKQFCRNGSGIETKIQTSKED